MKARIYRPSKTAMQSGRAKTQDWVLEFSEATKRVTDPVMGWTSASGTEGQVQLKFETREEAISYARREGLVFTVEEPRERKRLVKSYAANFDPSRKQPWTH